MEEHSRFQTDRLGMDGVQLSCVDKIETFLLYFVSLHIDVQLEFSLHKIQDFHLVMPVVFYPFPVRDLKNLVKAAGKRGCAVVFLFLQIQV